MSEKKYRYKIANWIFEPASLELRQGSKKVILQNQVANVLMELIQANGQTVSKKELFENVWKDTVVTENSLDKSISELRKVFQDSRAEPKFIQTIPKKGYRLVAPLKIIEIDNKTVHLLSNNAVWPWAIGSLALLVIALLVAFLYTSGEHKVLSPDGQLIASIKNTGAQYGLFLDKMTDLNIQKIDSFPQPESIVLNWSSNNQNIVYNTTLTQDDFFSIRVFHVPTSKITYIKFPKKEGTDLPPQQNIKTPSELLEHRKMVHQNNAVHFINYDRNDTLKVLLTQGKISDFRW